MRSPSLSIVIPTYNRAELLRLTLDSIVRQNIDPADIETIVVDDGSSDNTRALVRSFNENRAPVKYFFQDDLGYRVATARNLGIRNATGKIVLFIDSGIILAPDCIPEHIRSHNSAAWDMVVLGYINFGDFGDHSKTNPDLREDIYTKCGDDIGKLSAPWALCWAGNISVKRDILVRIGLFDENYNFNWGVEDIDLGYRLYQYGCRFKLNRAASTTHHPHESDLAEKLKQEMVNKQYFNSKFNNQDSLALLHAAHGVDLNMQLWEKSNYRSNIK